MQGGNRPWNDQGIFPAQLNESLFESKTFHCRLVLLNSNILAWAGSARYLGNHGSTFDVPHRRPYTPPLLALAFFCIPLITYPFSSLYNLYTVPMANVANIPIIDLSAVDQEQVALDLVEAAVEHGFVYIKNTGKDIPVDAVEGAFKLV